MAHAEHPLAGADELRSPRSPAPLLLPPAGAALRRVLDRAAGGGRRAAAAQAEIDGVRLLAALAVDGLRRGDRAGHRRPAVG